MGRSRFEAPCRVEIEHSEERLCAHVELEGGIEVRPGDRVLVHGAPIAVEYGQRRVVERMATIVRAGPLARLWTRIAGHLELSELYEVSFSHGALR